MAKWKCDICNSEFDNFQAQGFDGIIYCPLCYFKKLNNDKDKEIERLNNIIAETKNYLKYQLQNLHFGKDTKAKMLCSMLLVMLDKELHIKIGRRRKR